MFVKDRMTKDPYTIQVSASINTLIGLMRDKKLRSRKDCRASSKILECLTFEN